MRLTPLIFAAALAAGLPATTMAQSTPPPPTPPMPAQNYSSDSTSQWFASGFVGANFNASSDRTVNIQNATDNESRSNIEFGGNIGYTWNRVFGVEFLADFTPTFEFENIDAADRVRLVDDPRVNTYMFNAIAAVPIGAGRFQPFVSGGVGSISLAADVLDNIADLNSSSRRSVNRLGTNVGGGVFGFAGNVGIRADVRYFHGSSADDATTITLPAGEQVTTRLLSGLTFWRANIGIAFRW